MRKLAGAIGTKGTLDADVADQLLAKIAEIFCARSVSLGSGPKPPLTCG